MIPHTVTFGTLTGGFADPARQSARAFRAALTALSQPGRIETLTGAQPPAPLSVAAGTLLLVLADATTGLWLAPSHDTKPLRDWITFHTGARFVPAERATLALGTWADLHPLDRFAIGLPDYPDRSATLIVEMPELHPQGARLTGPGIATESYANLPEIAAFQANRQLFPLGLDFFFTAQDRVAGLPRTTKVEAS
ncbi:MAG: phosphonate C-P lyase system protein PhnH [Candidatus Saccharibacteria bacterium]|nr:phosphonate C-P lyase system protein PhnH [Pseudorhodobacter sp.]